MEEKNLRTTSFGQTPLEKKVNCSFVGNWRIFPRSSISIRSKCYHFGVINWETLLSKSKQWLCFGKFPAETNFSWIFKTSFKLISVYIHPKSYLFIINSDIRFISRLFDIWHGDREQLLLGDAWPQGSALLGAGADATYYNLFKVGVLQIRKAKKL